MNERIKYLLKQSTRDIKDEFGNWISSEIDQEKFASLIIQDCISEAALVGMSNYENDDISWASKKIVDSIKDKFKKTEDRIQIGWTEREEGFYKLYAPVKGSIVTQAFIHCKYCGGSIYHCMGPRYDAICLKCFQEKVEVG